MKSFLVKIRQNGVAPISLQVIAHTSVEALSIALTTLKAPASLVVQAC